MLWATLPNLVLFNTGFRHVALTALERLSNYVARCSGRTLAAAIDSGTKKLVLGVRRYTFTGRLKLCGRSLAPISDAKRRCTYDWDRHKPAEAKTAVIKQ